MIRSHTPIIKVNQAPLRSNYRTTVISLTCTCRKSTIILRKSASNWKTRSSGTTRQSRSRPKHWSSTSQKLITQLKSPHSWRMLVSNETKIKHWSRSCTKRSAKPGKPIRRWLRWSSSVVSSKPGRRPNASSYRIEISWSKRKIKLMRSWKVKLQKRSRRLNTDRLWAQTKVK